MCSAAGMTCLLQAVALNVLPTAALPRWAWGTTCARLGPEQEVRENQQQHWVTLSLTLVVTAWLHPKTAEAIASLKPLFCVSSSNSQAEKCTGLQISALLSQQGTGAIKQPLELSSSALSAAPKHSPILGSAAARDLGHAAWKTPATRLGGQRPALTPSHHREQTAVHVRVPTLPMSLPACCPPSAREAAPHPLASPGTTVAQCH